MILQEKCSQYWPDKGNTKSWGVFKTESISEEKFADYVIRQFSLKNEVRSFKILQMLMNSRGCWMVVIQLRIGFLQLAQNKRLLYVETLYDFFLFFVGISRVYGWD